MPTAYPSFAAVSPVSDSKSGGSGDDYCFSILPAADGYFLAGTTNSTDRDMSGSPTHGDYDIWVGKLLVE